MRFSMLPSVFAQMFKKPWTNKFPAKYAPSNTTQFLKDVGDGKAEIIPPIPPEKGFRGKIKYDKPCEAIEFKPKTKKIKIYLARCCFCSQCNDVCPTNCLTMGEEFLLADADPYSKDLIVE